MNTPAITLEGNKELLMNLTFLLTVLAANINIKIIDICAIKLQTDESQKFIIQFPPFHISEYTYVNILQHLNHHHL